MGGGQKWPPPGWVLPVLTKQLGSERVFRLFWGKSQLSHPNPISEEHPPPVPQFPHPHAADLSNMGPPPHPKNPKLWVRGANGMLELCARANGGERGGTAGRLIRDKGCKSHKVIGVGGPRAVCLAPNPAPALTREGRKGGKKKKITKKARREIKKKEEGGEKRSTRPTTTTTKLQRKRSSGRRWRQEGGGNKRKPSWAGRAFKATPVLKKAAANFNSPVERVSGASRSQPGCGPSTSAGRWRPGGNAGRGAGQGGGRGRGCSPRSEPRSQGSGLVWRGWLCPQS